MSTETTMRYLHISTVCAHIYCINSDFIDISYIPICDRFEILDNRMQSVAPSAVHPEKVFVELPGAQAAGAPAFGMTPPFFHQASHVCGTGCQRHQGKAQ